MSSSSASQNTSSASVNSRGSVLSIKSWGSKHSDGNLSRGAWGGKLEFILTCIGYAIGLGNVWRFPYLTYKNGGGAFLIPYVLMAILIGMPLFFFELSFGQFASLGPIVIWKVSPIMKGVGFAMVFTSLMITLYYNVIICWCLYFLLASMTDKLPWESCGNYWNSARCTLPEEYQYINWTYKVIDGMNLTKADLKSPSDEYFYNQVLQMTPAEEGGIGNLGTVVLQLACCLFVCWVIVFFVLVKGISSLGKVVYFTSTFPYVLLTIMLIRGVTLEGAGMGIEFYLIPDWSKLLDATVWSDAANQIFYAVGVSTGSLIALASYNDFRNNALRDAIIVPITNCLTSFYAGFVIFSVLGYMAHTKGVSVDEVAADGPDRKSVV